MKLLSLEFFALAMGAAVILPAVRGGVRWTLFFLLNVIYAGSYLYHSEDGSVALQVAGLVSTAGLSLVGYFFAWWARGGRRVAVVTGVITLTASFVYLRHYSLLDALLPAGWASDLLVTAGLSFLFFKIIHVLIDSGSGTIGVLRFSTYINYCLNFTTFLLGPIQRYQDFSDQWHGRKPALGEGFEVHLDAANRVLRGLVKKFVLAEFIRRFSMHAGMDIDACSAGELLWRTDVFYLYLYLDFSGYCDIMIGIGALMGIRPPENFHLPFLSRNVSNYWLRVHKSLTLWLTDYVFTPCFAAALRSRLMKGRIFLALTGSLMVTMFVSGLWHGTTPAFVLFGLVHGVYLVTTRGYEQVMVHALGRKRFRQWTKHPLVHLVAVLLTYQATSFAYVFFVMDVGEVGRYLTKMVGL